MFHISCIHNVITIEPDTIVRDRAVERILKQAHTVFVYIHILEHILQHRSQHIPCIEEFVNTGRIQPLDYVLFAFRLFTENGLSQGFIHRQRQNVLVSLRTILHLFAKEWILLEKFGFAQRVGCNVIQSQRQFLIDVVAIIVFLLQVVQLLGRHHFLHQLYCRIILTRILFALRPYHYLVQGMVHHFQRNIQILSLRSNWNSFGCISYGRKGQFFPFHHFIHLESAVNIRDTAYTFTFVENIHKRNGFTSVFILYNSLNLGKRLKCPYQKQKAK